MKRKRITQLNEICQAICKLFKNNKSEYFTTEQIAEALNNEGFDVTTRKISPYLLTLQRNNFCYRFTVNGRKAKWRYQQCSRSTGVLLVKHFELNKLFTQLLSSNTDGLTTSQLYAETIKSFPDVSDKQFGRTIQTVMKNTVTRKLVGRKYIWKLNAVSGKTIVSKNETKLKPIKVHRIESSLEKSQSTSPKSQTFSTPTIVEKVNFTNFIKQKLPDRTTVVAKNESSELFEESLRQNIKSANRSQIKSLINSEFNLRVNKIKQELKQEFIEAIDNL